MFRSVYADGGKVLRTIHLNGTVHDFDADTGKHLQARTLPVAASKHFLTVSTDGKLLATATDDGICTVWDLSTGAAQAKPKAKLFGYRKPGTGPGGPFPLPPPPLPINPAPRLKPAAPPPVGGPRPPPPFQIPPGPPQFVAAFSADAKQLAALTGDDDTVTVFDTTTGAKTFAVKVPKGTGAVAFSADGTHLFTGQGRPVTEVQQPGAKAAEPVDVRRFVLKTGKEVQSWKPLAGEKREGLRFARSEVIALYPLPDKETLLVVEAQLYNMWPPPPIPAGGRIPLQRFTQVRVLSLPGREKEKVVSGGRTPDPLGISPDGKAVGFVTTDTTDPNKPVTLVKLIDVASGKTKSATLATTYGNADLQRGVSFRPGGKEFAVRAGDGTVLVSRCDEAEMS